MLAVSLFMQSRAYNYITTIVFATGCAIGFWLAIVLVAAIYEKLEIVGDVPKGLKGPGIIMLITGIIAMAFLGFSGIASI